jgi:hypothetical protein
MVLVESVGEAWSLQEYADAYVKSFQGRDYRNLAREETKLLDRPAVKIDK